MLMLCFRIACIHVLPVKAIPEPSLEVVCLHASFFWTASDPDLKQNLYVKNPSSNGNDIRRFPAGTWWCADAMGNEPQKRVCSLAGTLQCLDFTSLHFGSALRERPQKRFFYLSGQKFMMQNPLNFCGNSSTTTLWTNSLFICFLIPPERGIPYRIFFLFGDGSCIKPLPFPTASAAWFTAILASSPNSNEWISILH